MAEIAEELGVSKSSVSVWVRDVEFVPRPRNRGHPAGAKHPMRLEKEAELERCSEEASVWTATLSRRDVALFCAGLHAGEGAKTEGRVSMANTNMRFLRLFLSWLREEFEIDDSRLRVRLYLHDGPDLDAAESFWSSALDVPRTQSRSPVEQSPTRRSDRPNTSTAVPQWRTQTRICIDV